MGLSLIGKLDTRLRTVVSVKTFRQVASSVSRELAVAASGNRATASLYTLGAELFSLAENVVPIMGDKSDVARRQANVLLALPEVWDKRAERYAQVYPTSFFPHNYVDMDLLTKHFDCFFIDIFGTYKDEAGIWPESIAVLTRLQQQKKPFIIVSNTSDLPLAKTLDQLREAGVQVDPRQVVTAGQILRRVFEQHHLIGQRVLTIGNEYSHEYVIDSMATPVDNIEGKYEGVVFSFRSLEPANPIGEEEALSRRLNGGKPLILANADRFLPRHSGLIENTAYRLARNVAKKMGAKLILVGKPEALIYQVAFERLQELGYPTPKNLLCIGDTIYTDILGAKQLQAARPDITVASLLLLSGTEGHRHDSWEYLELYLKKGGVFPTFVLPRMKFAA